MEKAFLETPNREEELKFWQALNASKCEEENDFDLASWYEADTGRYDDVL